MRYDSLRGGVGFGKIPGFPNAFGCRRVLILIHAVGTHCIHAGIHLRVFHRQAYGTVSAHGMSGEAPAVASRERAVVTVDIRDELASDKGFPIAGGDRAAVEAPSVTGI